MRHTKNRARPRWITPFGPARKNKRNQERRQTVPASHPSKGTPNTRRSQRQAIARLATKTAQPVAHGRHRSRYWRRLEMRGAS